MKTMREEIKIITEEITVVINSGMQSPYSSRSVNSSYEGSEDQYKIWSAAEMEQWQEHMEKFTNDTIARQL
jgi:hypothetical protein